MTHLLNTDPTNLEAVDGIIVCDCCDNDSSEMDFEIDMWEITYGPKWEITKVTCPNCQDEQNA